ncbi:MAG: tRNA adenosine(34) deaminase TadA [Firmicutes bacterium]|nr:tRNA adenosine(34) deaminase TadA [Bacillota bacterium]
MCDITENADEYYMGIALEYAKKAFENNEVPIGCIIVQNGNIIGTGFNDRKTKGTVFGHAEMVAIKQACDYLGDWRLEECTAYVTIEPCPMCAGALLQARIPRLVFGARNPKSGCVGSLYNLLSDPRFNHVAQITEGILEKECGEIMTEFFKNFREREKLEKRNNTGL